MSNADKPFPWGLWALVGFVGWIVVMLAIGLPTLTLAAPAAGVLAGWLVGGIFNLLMRLRPRRHRRTVGGTPGPRLSGNRAHWERVYRDHSPESVSWFEREPRGSLSMIEGLGLEPHEAIVDVGGGTSRLADELLRRGFNDVTVMDISGRALDLAREGLDGSEQVEWVVGDVRNHDFGRQFALWHDRAVFHFMTEPEDRDAYLETLVRSVRPGGHLVVVTFGPGSPPHCSGLPVTRYSPESLAEALGEVATLESHRYHEHRTPGGATQQHLYAHLVMRGA